MRCRACRLPMELDSTECARCGHAAPAPPEPPMTGERDTPEFPRWLVWTRVSIAATFIAPPLVHWVAAWTGSTAASWLPSGGIVSICVGAMVPMDTIIRMSALRRGGPDVLRSERRRMIVEGWTLLTAGALFGVAVPLMCEYVSLPLTAQPALSPTMLIVMVWGVGLAGVGIAEIRAAGALDLP